MILLYFSYLKSNSQALLCRTLHKEIWWNQSLLTRAFHLLFLLTAVQQFMEGQKRTERDQVVKDSSWSLVVQSFFFLPKLIKSKGEPSVPDKRFQHLVLLQDKARSEGNWDVCHLPVAGIFFSTCGAPEWILSPDSVLDFTSEAAEEPREQRCPLCQAISGGPQRAVDRREFW